MKRIQVRVPDDLAQVVEETARKRGYESVNAFVRQAIGNEIKTDAVGIKALRDDFDRFVAGFEATQSRTFALVDALLQVVIRQMPRRVSVKPNGDAELLVMERPEAAKMYQEAMARVANTATAEGVNGLAGREGVVLARREAGSNHAALRSAAHGEAATASSGVSASPQGDQSGSRFTKQ